MSRVACCIGLAFFLWSFSIEMTHAHSGGTNAAGCHTNRRTGDYHCHNPKPRAPGRVTYCHVINGEDRCGYALSTCRNLVRQFGGSCRLETATGGSAQQQQDLQQIRQELQQQQQELQRLQRQQLQQKNEDAYNTEFCARVGGRTEVRHPYTYPTGQSFVRVDCETEKRVYEGGLDNKRSSLDSVQQALFFANLTGKKPAVVIYDTDGQIGQYEHRIKVACDMAGVTFLSVQ